MRKLFNIALAACLLAPTVALGGTYLARRDSSNLPKDWGPLMQLHLRFDDVTDNDTTRDFSGNFGDSFTECSGCAISRNVFDRTANLTREPWRTAAFTAPEYFTCANATCDLRNAGNDVTWGCWTRIQSAARALIIGDGTDDTAATGYMAFRKVTTNKLSCAAAGVVEDGATTMTNDQWWHSVCVASDSTDGLLAYLNGAVDGGAATSMTGSIVESAGNFLVNTSDTAKDWDGYVDDCFVTDQALVATDICRICSLGVDGKMGECDATTPTLYKSCTSNADCNGGIGICTDAASEDNCADASERCCMGYNAIALTAGGGSVGATAAEQCLDCDLPACNQAVFSPPAAVYPQNWAPTMVALYKQDNGATDSSTGGSETAALTPTSITYGTTAPLSQGTHYSIHDSGATDRYTCNTSSGCTDNQALPLGTSMTWGGWVRPTAAIDANDDAIMQKHASSLGFRMMRRGSGSSGRAYCQVNANTLNSTVGVNVVDPGTDQWFHQTCRWDDPSNTLATFVKTSTSTNDKTTTTPGTSLDIGNSGTSFGINTSSALTNFNGHMDEMFISKKSLTDAQICRICSVGVDGIKGRCDEPVGFQQYYKPCDSNTDCGGTALCDTAATTVDDTYCGVGVGEYAEPFNGCCAGQNTGATTLGCGGCDLAACNEGPP